MERYLKSGVKTVIEQFPQVGEILTRYGVGCVQCTVGTCLLEDVVKIHALEPTVEAEMMADIEQIIYPNRTVTRTPTPPAAPPAPRALSYSPPVKKLVDEHVWIKRLLVLLPVILNDMKAASTVDAEVARGVITFIREYADRYHHLKEEDILFEYTDREAEIIKVIYQDHDTARGHVRAAWQAIEENDIDALTFHLLAYRELLTEHIAKEDEILYPYIDRPLTTAQVGQMYQHMQEAEARLDPELATSQEQFVLTLEHQYAPIPTCTADLT